MDKEKLRAFLNSRKDLESGSLFGFPISHGTPTLEEIEQMPDDLKKLVIDSQLDRSGMYIPAAKSNFGEDLQSKAKNEVRMADEISAEEGDLRIVPPGGYGWPDISEPSESAKFINSLSRVKNPERTARIMSNPKNMGNISDEIDTDYYPDKLMQELEPKRFSKVKDFLKSRK
jgi:hypothetical protein